ncbi:RNA polymerase II-associated [Coniochaeta sp. 2T2.1]|nr:RNA polymerase II-associated [Coniochaeta sp. 2T2.1]
MAASQSRGGERMIHQDFIARIRFSNALPPPPVPPKLLDIPNTGLASGQYTNPGFASRLAREQPLNIETDAELGMPIDLVGLPGVFEGDESAVQPPTKHTPVHPHDRALLRPLATLGKPKVNETSVSFLRRTEYISGMQTTSRKVDVFLKNKDSTPARRVPQKRKAPASSPEPDKGTPAYVKRKINKSFEAAAAALKDRTRVKHPSKPARSVKLLDAYPLLPDLDAFPDSGTYVTIKFTHNPVPPSSTYDNRLLSGVFVPIQRTEEEDAAYEAAMEAHERDPERVPAPDNKMNYDFYLASDPNAAKNFRRRFDVEDPERDSDALYPKRSGGESGKGAFAFRRVRAYETSKEEEVGHAEKYSQELILAFNDADKGSKPRGLYYYPVMQRSTVRAQRSKNIARTVVGMQEGEERIIDQLDVAVVEPEEEVLAEMARYREHPFGVEEEEEEELEEEQRQEEEVEEHSQETAGRSKAGSVSPGDNGDVDVDAEGEEED